MGKRIAAFALCGALILCLFTGCANPAIKPSPVELTLLDGSGQPVGEQIVVPPGQTTRYSFENFPEEYKVEKVAVSDASVLTAAWNEGELLIRSAAEGKGEVTLTFSDSAENTWDQSIQVLVMLPETGLFVGPAEDNPIGTSLWNEDGTLTMTKGETYRLAISAEDGAYLHYRWSGLAATATLEGKTLLITAQQEGEGVITLTAEKEGSATAEVSIPVTVGLPAVSGVKLSSLDFDPKIPLLLTDKEYTFTLVGLPTDAKWTVKCNPYMADITQKDGSAISHILPLAAGTVELQVQVHANGYQTTDLTFSLPVEDELPHLELQAPAVVDGTNQLTLPVGGTTTLLANHSGELTYVYSEGLFALEEGTDGFTLTALHAGSGELVFTVQEEGLPEVTRRLAIHVVPSLLELTVSEPSVDIDLLDRPQLTLTANEEDVHLRVSISHPIARVMIQDGILTITPLEDGEAVITVVAEKEDYTPAVVEIPLAIGLQKITLTADTDQVITKVGANAQVGFEIDPKDATVGVTVDGNMAVVYYQDGIMYIDPKVTGETIVTVTASKTGYATEELPIQLIVLGKDGMATALSTASVERDSTAAARLIELVNSERTKAGVPELTVYTPAVTVAQMRGGELLADFSHTRPNGQRFSTALSDTGVTYSACGENIAMALSTPEEVVSSWMASEDQRAAVLDADYTLTGAVCCWEEAGEYYWVMLFLAQ